MRDLAAAPHVVMSHQTRERFFERSRKTQRRSSLLPQVLSLSQVPSAMASWEMLTEGLPGPHDYQSVYREGLDTDGLDQEGVYVGTSNGQVYASADGGDHWTRLPGTLPAVLSVTVSVS